MTLMRHSVHFVLLSIFDTCFDGSDLRTLSDKENEKLSKKEFLNSNIRRILVHESIHEIETESIVASKISSSETFEITEIHFLNVFIFVASVRVNSINFD